jgi:hypothetical protein
MLRQCGQCASAVKCLGPSGRALDAPGAARNESTDDRCPARELDQGGYHRPPVLYDPRCEYPDRVRIQPVSG